MGNIHIGIPKDLALFMRDKFGLTTLVETGTFMSKTTRWAAGEFKRVYSIEAHEPFYQQAVEKCAAFKNIMLVSGDTRAELPNVLKKLRKPALLWLDAHWLGNIAESSGTDGECPLNEELDALETCPVQHYVLIDDLHCFIGELPAVADPANWPSYETIKLRFEARGYSVVAFEDVIIAVPTREAMAQVREYIRKPGLRVLVPTSNDYAHLVAPFAYLFNKHWSPEQLVTVLRYDVRPPKVAPNFYKPSIGKQADFTWSSGLLSYLRQLDYELLILLLEDYFLFQKVNVAAIEKLWRHMEKHPEVVKIDLSGDRLREAHSDYGEAEGIGLVKSGEEANWQTSLQAAIWRKDFLERFLVEHENPWQFERGGTRRVIAARQAGEFDGVILGVKVPLLTYVNAVGGEGKRPGELDVKKFPPELLAELREQRLIV